jgi:hypothetical protein
VKRALTRRLRMKLPACAAILCAAIALLADASPASAASSLAAPARTISVTAGKPTPVTALPWNTSPQSRGMRSAARTSGDGQVASTGATPPVPVVEMLPEEQQTSAASSTCQFVSSAGSAWCYYSKYSTGFEAGARYGVRHGSTYTWYGEVYMYFRILIKTTRAYALIQFYHPAKKQGGIYGYMQLGMAAERIYYSPRCTAGCPVSPSTLQTYSYPGNIPVNRWVYWGKNSNYGYEASQPPVHVGAVNVAFLWKDSRIPNTVFLCYGKSIHYYFREVGGRLTDSAIFYGPQVKVWKAHLGVRPAGCSVN